MAARKSSRVNRQYKTKYRVRNWREYERPRVLPPKSSGTDPPTFPAPASSSPSIAARREKSEFLSGAISSTYGSRPTRENWKREVCRASI